MRGWQSCANILKSYNLQTIDSLGEFTQAEVICAGVLIDYVQTTQKGKLPRIATPVKIFSNEIMEIDYATRYGLELIQPNYDGGISLLKVLDKTITNSGARLLSNMLSSPCINPNDINNRLDRVNFFVDHPNIIKLLRDCLRQFFDINRSLQRLSINRGGPKDLYNIAHSLQQIPNIKHIITSFQTYQNDSIYPCLPDNLFKLLDKLITQSNLVDNILNVLLDKYDELPTITRNGGFIKPNVNAELDYFKNIRNESKIKCEELKEKYIEQTGITNLKIKDNSIIGYFVEIPTKSSEIMLSHEGFIHRQTVLNAVRYTTIELSALQDEVVNAEQRALEIEIEIFDNLTDFILAQADNITKSVEIIAKLDVASSLALGAIENNYTRPIIDDSFDMEIVEGRHPVVEYVLSKNGNNNFVANDCVIKYDNDRLWLLTGPNMAGKSTFLRQNALITIIAQMGGYVPAKYARIGIVDKLFSRIGARDDLSRGQSTFMVEMIETAAILNQSTNRSFVILDEIGRGTSTYDGLSIAWSVVEQLSEVNKCRTIFATHYHELTKLKSRQPFLSLHCMKVKEFNQDIIFMHEVIDGSADRSYGIHVAKLAGLPSNVINRAEQVLKILENEKNNKNLASINNTLPLFEEYINEIKEESIEKSPIIDSLENIDIDNLSPKDALDYLYKIKSLL